MADVIFTSMNLDYFQQNWALIVAGMLVLSVAATVLSAAIRRSAGGQLRQTLTSLKVCVKQQAIARIEAEKAEKKLIALLARADNVKPRSLEEAKGLLSDKRALEKIADDKLLIAKNHVRRVIHEEYPPKEHDRLRSRYLPDDVEDKKPFSF